MCPQGKQLGCQLWFPFWLRCLSQGFPLEHAWFLLKLPTPEPFTLIDHPFPKMVKSFPKPYIQLFPKAYNKQIASKTKVQRVLNQKLQKPTFTNLHHKAHCKFPQLVYTSYTDSSTLQKHFFGCILAWMFLPVAWGFCTHAPNLLDPFPKIKVKHFPTLPMCATSFSKDQRQSFSKIADVVALSKIPKFCPFPKAATFSKAATSWIFCW